MTSAIPFDYHSHHRRCGHAIGDMRDYIEAACAQEMTSFGVSDHGPAYWLPGDHDQPLTQMAKSEAGNYVAEAQRLKEEYASRIHVCVGMEADYIEGREDDLRRILDTYPFDYVLGSVHYTFGMNIFNVGRWDYENPEETYTEYYRLVQRAAETGLFDILSHLTAVESFGPPVPRALADRLYPPVADAVAASGAIVEINTSGYRKMPPGPGRTGDEPFPNRHLLSLLIDRGVPLTFSSDCHKPSEVGFAADRVLQLLGEFDISLADVQPQIIKRRQTAVNVFVTR